MAELQGDEVRVNFDAEAKQSEWPPEGAHLAKVVKCDGQRSSKGDPMLYWEFEVVTNDGSRYRRIWTNTSLKPDALWRMRDLVNACGVFPGPDGFKRSEMLGKMLRVWVKHEWYCKQHNLNHSNDECPDKKSALMAKVDDYAPAA